MEMTEQVRREKRGSVSSGVIGTRPRGLAIDEDLDGKHCVVMAGCESGDIQNRMGTKGATRSTGLLVNAPLRADPLRRYNFQRCLGHEGLYRGRPYVVL